MITSIIGAIAMVGSFLYQFAIDYISNILVGAVIFPAKVIEVGCKYAELLSKPLSV